MSSKHLKTSYSVQHQVESFFTGIQLQFDSTGKFFYCAKGSIVNKVSVADGQVKAQVKCDNEDDNVIRFVLAPNDQLLIIAYHSGLIMKYNLANETIEREFKSIHNAPISYMKINQSSTLLATASSDGTVKLWNLSNHYCSHNMKGINGVVSCVEFLESSDEDEEGLLFCAAGDDSIHIFDIGSSKRLVRLATHCSTITDMKIVPRRNKLISVGRDKIAVIWNIDKSDENNFGTTIRTIPIYESVESIALLDANIINSLLQIKDNDDDIYFATIGEEGQIKFWDSKTGANIFSQNQPPLSSDRSPSIPCLQLMLRPNHQELCAISYERDIFLYSLPKLELVQQLQGHIDEILAACWFANDNYIAIACNSNDLTIMEVKTSKTQHLKGHTDLVLCVKSVPRDPYCLISSSKDCSILIWMFEPETMVHSILYKCTGHTHSVYSLAVLYDEKIFFSGGEDTTLKKWSFSRNKNHETTDNILIASQTIKAHDDRIDDLSISPNDQLIASGSRDKTAKIFSVDGMRLLATLKGHRRGIHALRFSPEDQVLVTAGDSTLKMWNLQDFACLKTFQGHDCSVLNFSFVSKGLQILSMGSDGNMKLWNCKTNECMKTIDAHSGNTWSLAATEDESKVVTGGQDQKLIIWRDTTKEEHEERVANLQSQVVQEQDFMNYINKKKWRKALKMAISMENPNKTLNVVREILLEPEGFNELERILLKIPLDQLHFVIECCVGWNATAKNSTVAQQVFYIIVSNVDNKELMRIQSLTSSFDQLKKLTEKSLDRYERLVQEASFVDFFQNSFRIQ